MCDLNKMSALKKFNHKNTKFNSDISNIYLIILFINVMYKGLIQTLVMHTQKKNNNNKKKKKIRI